MQKRCLLTLIVICIFIGVLLMAMIPIAHATDMSDVTINNMKTLLYVIGKSTSSFEQSLTVKTTFEPSYMDLQIDRLIDYARDVDPYTGSLLYGVRWETEPFGNEYKVHFKFLYYINEQQYNELQQFAIDFSRQMDEKSNYEKIKITHDYLIENCTYDINMDGPYNCIFNGRCNCNGYALAFYLIMRECEIECDYVAGTGHAWNAVKLGPFWYNVDVTWDDTNDNLSYEYFLKGRADWKGHDRNTATAGYSYDQYNELENWITTIFYWFRWPVLAIFTLSVRSKTKKRW